MYTVIFICTGNTCRSPMAEALLKARLKKGGVKGVKVDSCGLRPEPGAPVSPLAVRALEKFGVKNFRRKAKSLTRALYDKADLLICMTENHKRFIERAVFVEAAGQGSLAAGQGSLSAAGQGNGPKENGRGEKGKGESDSGAPSRAEVATVAQITGGGDVGDPWGGSEADYLKTAEYLEYACADIVGYITGKMKAKPRPGAGTRTGTGKKQGAGKIKDKR